MFKKIVIASVLALCAAASASAQSRFLTTLRWSDRGKLKPAFGAGLAVMGGDINSNPGQFNLGGRITTELEFMVTHQFSLRLDANYMMLNAREDEQRAYERRRNVPLTTRTHTFDLSLNPTYYLTPISTFAPFRKTIPFVAASVGIMKFVPTFESNDGYKPLNDLLKQTAQLSTLGATFGGGAGVFINLTESSNLIIEGRGAVVFNDNLDGISSQPRYFTQLTGPGQEFYRKTQKNLAGNLNGGGPNPDFFMTLMVKYQFGIMTEREFNHRSRTQSPIAQ